MKGKMEEECRAEEDDQTSMMKKMRVRKMKSGKWLNKKKTLAWKDIKYIY